MVFFLLLGMISTTWLGRGELVLIGKKIKNS
jgi:hypothetical protein